ncbi:hypothetical protein [Micromonospora tarensis]|uniref:Heparin binding hemagglutinin HbhA n=1 Tax=Micromonospora tarensis TaxID=2806100 RepID=A0ABS1YQE0_9ACTN|nr:hypothetical protein [Micromonospora tarensis]MBM0279655.1 hypothetical protein [Micromonospora tarensis]
MRSGGRSLLGRSRPSGTSGARSGSSGSAAKRPLGGLFSRTASKPARKAASRNGGLAGFLRGVREGAEPKPPRPVRTSAPEPKHASGETAENRPAQRSEKPQRPTKEQLVKEAVQKAAKVKPAAAAPRHTGGSTVGDINKIRAAADEFAAALKGYDPESMHQLVREMPQLGEALNSVQQGFRQVASRAESEWPVAAPVAEGLRSIADDIKAGAGTAEETRGTIRRENETDIERGEAPRHGSVEVERKWNV